MNATQPRSLALALLAAGVFLAFAACATSRGSEPRISSMGILRLQSPDPARLARWYQENLGFPKAEQKDGALAGEMQTTWGPLVYRIEPLPEGAAPRPVDVSFAVNRLEPFVERLTRAGSPPFKRDHTVEGRSAWFRDPDGNTLELTER
ncbi:MAG: VOC family protein [Thermoanaerobaculia bacterium]